MDEKDKDKDKKDGKENPADDLQKLTPAELVALAKTLKEENQKLKHEREESDKKNAENSARIIKSFLQGDDHSKPAAKDGDDDKDDPYLQRFLTRNNNL